jgi:Virus neck protein
MATNVYFSQKVKSEQHLYEDIIIESLKMYGQDVMYLPRTMTRDPLLNEVIESKFLDAYTVEMYVENVQGFEGDQSFVSKFGLEIRDQATFVVARRSWEKLVGMWNNTLSSVRPLEGDLLYLPLSKSFFEIKFVEHEAPFYQLSNLVVYKLQCELFDYSNEVIDTGNPVVDDFQRLNANGIILLIDGGINGDFANGDTVVQKFASGLELSAEVINVEYVNSSQRRLTISNVNTTDGKYHEFVPTVRIINTDTGASWNVVELYGISNPYVDNTFPESQQAQNREFEIESNAIIDFSEQNPFGEPSEVYSGLSYTSTQLQAMITMDSTTIRVDSSKTVDIL